ncbi:MAG TPA: hypothetical protein VE131_06260, partial [Terriglobales bacterium]|nr:hypothetical protein [Terriglobales bacterium]
MGFLRHINPPEWLKLAPFLVLFVFAASSVEAGQEWQIPQTDLVFDQDSFLAAHIDHESAVPVVNWSLPVNLWQKNLMLETKYIQKPESALTQEAIHVLSNQNSLLRLRMAAPLVSGVLMSEGEVSYSFLSDQRRGLWNSDNRLARARFTGGWQGFQYAAEMRSVGKTFVSIDGPQPIADQEGGEIWVERRLGVLKLRLSAGSFSDNLEHETDRLQMTTSQGRVTAYLDRAPWPSIKFAYGRQLETSAREPQGVSARDRWVDTWESTVERRIHNWQPSFSSFLSITHDRLD